LAGRYYWKKWREVQKQNKLTERWEYFEVVNNLCKITKKIFVQESKISFVYLAEFYLNLMSKKKLKE
jgi:hypothetical protein